MKHSKTDILFQIVNYALLVTFTFCCFYPFYYIFIYSLSDASEIAGNVSFAPVGLTLHNYTKIFELNDIGQAFLISLLRTITGTAITVFSCMLFSYLLTRKELVARKLMYRSVIITLYFNAGLIPWYLTMRMYGLKDNFLLYILPSAIVGFFVILIKTFIEEMPIVLQESAMIDGAGYFRIFRSVIFPLALPIAATIAVFQSVGHWNAWTDNFFLVRDPHLQTLQMILWDYLNEAEFLAERMRDMTSMGNVSRVEMSPETIKMTITMIATLPILVVYPMLQRYFVKGIMLGAVKG
ncbi:carbohydrate ABC transporter permease [Cohnella silvisoli]|uniref:Carbohydrate ABC transporter permease n=1 Tax=Cohnella silvisoli TaxID=2873699 RepID=A0ABV1KLQ6_9BACL|nr:carbohydrate ABC transporter permease [Cohnella silvisoli]MCD9020644.1 carbohydrate ABC transporter permease [Cohnella silvisoli]